MSKQGAKEQVVAAYDGGEKDYVRLANQFGASESFVRCWLRLAHRVSGIVPALAQAETKAGSLLRAVKSRLHSFSLLLCPVLSPPLRRSQSLAARGGDARRAGVRGERNVPLSDIFCWMGFTEDVSECSPPVAAQEQGNYGGSHRHCDHTPLGYRLSPIQ